MYISLGLARYSPWKFVTSTFVGKLVINEIVVWAAVYSGKPFIDKFAYHDTIEPFNMAISIIISIFIAVAIIYTFMRVDLEKVIRKYFPRVFEDEKTE